MYQNDRSRYSAIAERRRARKQKRTAMLAALAMAGILLVGGTVAWMTSSTGTVVNTFLPGSITTEVKEDIGGGVKSNVAVKNTGSVNAYIRVTVVVNWVDAAGNVVADKPVLGTDYEMSTNVGANAWFVQDGYYYWPEAVAPGASTGILIESCKPTEAGLQKGYDLKVDVIASGIQSVPTSVVAAEWGVGVSGETLVPNVSDSGVTE